MCVCVCMCVSVRACMCVFMKTSFAIMLHAPMYVQYESTIRICIYIILCLFVDQDICQAGNLDTGLTVHLYVCMYVYYIYYRACVRK